MQRSPLMTSLVASATKLRLVGGDFGNLRDHDDPGRLAKNCRGFFEAEEVALKRDDASDLGVSFRHVEASKPGKPEQESNRRFFGARVLPQRQKSADMILCEKPPRKGRG